MGPIDAKSALFYVMAWYRMSDKPLTATIMALNSSTPSAAYMLQWIKSTLDQIKACRLFGAKLLSERMLDYCQLDP